MERTFRKIQKVTISEESNRNIIINLKARFRELKDRYAKTENNYEDIKKVLIAHIENIASGFEKFEAILMLTIMIKQKK